MELVIVEREYDEPLTEEEAERMVREGSPCFDLRRVKHVVTYLSKDGRRAFCAYEAPDAAAVRAANEEQGSAYVRVWSACVIARPPDR